ncbi:MAG: hypothetical protein GY849_13725, partial [Deltaproteobacteria bacterium]|nr:hypothetical protein [Deltaproteobacteria bacterium]
DGSTAKYEYNDHDQLRKESMVSASKPNHKPYRYEGTYTYYPDGALDTRSSSYGTGKKLDGSTVKYTYTPRNMVETITDVSKGHVVQYTYDLNDNITGIESHNGQDGNARALFTKIHMDYNDLNQVEFVKFSDGSKGYSFAYDSMGNVATIEDTFKNTTSFKYDGINRLQEVKDPLNNRVEAGFTDFGNETILRHYSGEELLR